MNTQIYKCDKIIQNWTHTHTSTGKMENLHMLGELHQCQIMIVKLSCNLTKYDHWREPSKVLVTTLCIFSYWWIWVYGYLNENFPLTSKDERLPKTGDSEQEKIFRILQMWYQKVNQKINSKVEVKNGGKGRGINSSVWEAKYQMLWIQKEWTEEMIGNETKSISSTKDLSFQNELMH